MRQAMVQTLHVQAPRNICPEKRRLRIVNGRVHHLLAPMCPCLLALSDFIHVAYLSKGHE